MRQLFYIQDHYGLSAHYLKKGPFNCMAGPFVPTTHCYKTWGLKRDFDVITASNPAPSGYFA